MKAHTIALVVVVGVVAYVVISGRSQSVDGGRVVSGLGSRANPFSSKEAARQYYRANPPRPGERFTAYFRKPDGSTGSDDVHL